MASAPDGSTRPRRVLVTRAARDAEPLRAALAERGVEVICMPTIEVVPPLTWTDVDTAIRRLRRYSWVAFTSRNAVEFFLDRMKVLDVTLLPPTRIAAIGSGTASRLTARGVAVDQVPEQPNGEALAALLTEERPAGPVLLPVGDLARPDLADFLRRTGAEVDTVTIYRTVSPEQVDQRAVDLLEGGEIAVVTVASPSALRNLIALLPSGGAALFDLPIVCIGATTGRAARELGLRRVVIAAETSTAGLTDAICSVLGIDGL